MSDPVFDSNIVIDWLLQREPALAELASCRTPRISRITWAEVLAGEPPASHEDIARMLRGFAIIEVDERIAATAADFRFRTRVKLLDALVYATAQLHGTILVTRNTKDFPASMPGIHVPYTL